MSDVALQASPDNDQNESTTRVSDSTPGGDVEIRWEVVAHTSGFTPATIVAGRLQSEGIPVRVWQEGAGRALGLTVGILGTGFVAVPKEYADQAERILAEPGDETAADVGTVGEED